VQAQPQHDPSMSWDHSYDHGLPDRMEDTTASEELNNIDEIRRQVVAVVEAERQECVPEPEQMGANKIPSAGDDSNAVNVKSLNERHAIIMLGGKCVVLNHITDPVTGRPDVNFSGIQDFRTRYQNKKIDISVNGHDKKISIADVWLNAAGRKEYQGIVFDPSRKENSACYNLWQGFAIMPKQGEWGRMQKHIRKIICSDDPEIFQYLRAWMARLVQDPGGKRPGVVVVLRGKQGVGKGVFVVNFSKIFGSHFMHIISHHLVAGRFNSHFKDALLVFVDEGFWGGDKKAEGILKGMVTEEFITVEPKGKEAFKIKNHSNFIFASNGDWVIPAATEERRFFTIDVAEARMGDFPYFKALTEEMENGGREAMLYDLLRYDISAVDLRKFPRREALLDQIIQTWPTSKKFWYETLRAGQVDFPNRSFYSSGGRTKDWPRKYPCHSLYKHYLDFSSSLGEKYNVLDKIFGKHLKELCPEMKRKRRYHDGYYYLFPTLEKCRSDFEDKVGMKIAWGEEENNEGEAE
jgi:hypothetical protein